VEPPSPAKLHDTSPHARGSLIATIAWTVLIGSTLWVCYFTHLNAVGLVGPDEPRYAWIARDMAESGDWITPRLYGTPWFEKPPLYYWSAALTFKLLGVNEVSARLPSALFALLATLAIGWLGWRAYGAETARWVFLVLPASVGMIGFSHAAATDMPFAATLTLALIPTAILLDLLPPKPMESPVSSAAAQASPTRASSFTPSSLLASIVLGFFLGLATLAKGPAALILCSGGVLCWAFLTKRWRMTLRLLHPAAIIAFCLTALPWYILCAIRNPDFFGVFIVEHNFKRFLTPEFQHIQPFWYYAAMILIAFLPWTAVLLWALTAGLNRIRRASVSSSTILLLCWSAFCAAFFTISRSKLPGYILPALPPIALLLARSCTLLANAKRWSLALSSLAFSALGAAAFVAILKNPEHLLRNSVMFKPLVLLFVVLIALSNVLFALLVLRRRNTAILFAVLPFFLAFQVFEFAAESTPLSILSPRYIASQIQAEQIPLTMLHFAKLKRTTLYGVNFYLRTNLHEWDGDPAREVYVLTDGLRCSMKPAEMNCEDLWGEQERTDVFDVLHLTPKN
jgi:4-amino-4-deoxy-L-arabinose transferase-like glycosyltransferase